ncbi:MAG: phosphoribosylglycinamide formyltransferase [Candidatus Omnitrophota bacterium]|jgi:phosphoribosylglycinamide formyltransferase-1|nr:phosphoribosylglycinamide formyltransferase [Candidatus Omnitrophota bacterium]
MKRKARISVFASGTGSNFLAIVKAVKSGLIRAEIAFLLCDNPAAPVIGKAARAGIRTLIVSRGDFSSRELFEAEVLYALRRGRVDLVVLAGFMRILSPSFVRRYRNRIINIHPSLLPSFKGARAIRDAFEYGAKVTGVTVHFVDEKTDHGPIIMQEEVKVGRNDTLAGLERRIHKAEHRIYPLAIDLFLRGRLRAKGRKISY